MIKKRAELSKLTTIHLSGWIDVNIIENSADILAMPESFVMMGSGSNLLVKNRKKNFYKLSKDFSYVYIKDNMLICGAALRISQLIRFLIKTSVSSLEFLAGVPATIGGAVYMNAGAFGDSIENKLVYVKAFCGGSKISVMQKEELKFGYRKSGFEGCIIIEAGFGYSKTEDREVGKKVAENMKKRVRSAHLSNTFGSVFKNPPDDYAGRLIEESGLKGLKKNSAMISKKHANYIIGKKKTDVNDVLFLMDKARESVFNNFGVELEEEVRVI